MRRLLGSTLSVVVLAFAGCNLVTPPADPAAVLEGTWQAEFAEPGDLEGYDVQLTFDADGKLTQITAEAPAGGTASLDVPDTTTTVVDGDQVTITVPSATGERIFEGSLSADENSITGSLSQELQLPSGDLTVTLPGSDLTLTRLES